MASKTLITESLVVAAWKRGETMLTVASGSIITPLAYDAARRHRVTISMEASSSHPGGRAKQSAQASPPSADHKVAAASSPASPRVIAIGADHGGFDLKKELSKFVESRGWTILDVGTHSNARCDYPDFAFAVARAVSLGTATFGIMIDGAGPGSAIVANKVPGIRAACGGSEFVAWNARAHNDCNVLTLGSRSTGIEICKRVTATFLETDFEGGRHLERVNKILDVERHFMNDPMADS